MTRRPAAPKAKRKRKSRKLREWSPKVNDPRQGDLIDHVLRKPQREGFALLDEAIRKTLDEAK